MLQTPKNKTLPGGTVFAPHYTVRELAESWKLSYNTVLRAVKQEPGILRIGSPSPRRRTKVTLRIPPHVAERIWKRLTGRKLD